jgi:DNA-binding transcriptional LysR family regulator
MDLRQLRYFVAVAEELHFTRAASRLHLAQSALSAQIRALEREVGAPLLERSTRRVILTPVGAALLADAREVLAGADYMLARARALARRQSDELAVGCLGPIPGELLTSVVRDLGHTHPGARVNVHAYDFVQIQGSLREAWVDVAFLYLPYDDEALRGLHVVPLADEPRVVVLARSHPFAEREALTPDDLVDEVFISHSPSVSQAWRDFWILTDQFDGRRPAVHPRPADTLEEWLHLIAQCEGIDTAPQLISRYYSWPAIRFVPLLEAPPATLAIARRRDGDEPLVEAFIDAAARVASHRDARVASSR